MQLKLCNGRKPKSYVLIPSPFERNKIVSLANTQRYTFSQESQHYQDVTVLIIKIRIRKNTTSVSMKKAYFFEKSNYIKFNQIFRINY
jgi:hypothetical protein